MRAKLQSKRGMTLIELITGMVILTLVAACLVTVVGPILGNYVRTKEEADATILTNNLCDVITAELSYALGSVNLQNGGNTIVFQTYAEGQVTLSFDGEILLKNDQSVFDAGYYKQYLLDGSFSLEDDLIQVTLRLSHDDGAEVNALHRTFSVRPIAS